MSRRHLRLLGRFVASSIQQDAEYRVSFLINIVNTTISLGAGAAVLYAMFQQGQSVGGWSFHEVVALLGVFTISQAATGLVVQPSLSKVSQYIELGSMDYMLLKPVNLQFTVSLRSWSIWHLPNFLLGTGLVVYGMVGTGTLTAANIAAFLAMLSAGLVILYALWAILTVTAFWFVRISNAHMLLHSLMGAARFPIGIYPGWLRLAFTFLLPIVFITNVPVEAAMAKLTWSAAAASIAVAAIMLTLSILAWRVAVRRYTSASS